MSAAISSTSTRPTRSVAHEIAQAAWLQPIVADRVTVTEPESVGVTLTAARGNEALLVIWRRVGRR
jgi:hypothetical protein